MRAVIYCRISKDPRGEAIGVRRQERDCHELAARYGLCVVDVLVDNDTSAFSGAARPAYNELLALVRGGDVDAVLAWHPDRLHRSLADLEEFITAVDIHDVAVHTVTAGDVDLATPVGRMLARQLGTFARYESEHRSERTRAGHRDIALQGRWHGGAPPYGYDRQRDAAGRPDGTGALVIVDEQAAVIREAARRILAGDTLTGVCRDLNRRAIPAPRGGTWSPPSLACMLVSPTTAGLRDYRGEFVTEGRWPPILTRQQHGLLRRRLADNRRTKGVRPAYRYLLTGGLITCGKCGYRMYTVIRHKSGRRSYTCVANQKPGCGSVSVAKYPLEKHVLAAFFTDIGYDNMHRLVANPRAFARELARRTEIEARMFTVAQLYAAGRITSNEWLAALDSLRTQLRTIPTTPNHLGGLTLADPTGLQHHWIQLPLERRRALLQLVIDTVIIHPTGRNCGKFNPDRVEIRWR